MTGATPAYVLALNAGSSSLKFALFDVDGTSVLRGKCGGFDRELTWQVQGAPGVSVKAPDLSATARNVAAVTHALIRWLETFLPAGSLQAIGHRVVHGGKLTVAQRITPDLVSYLESLADLAPLHQPQSLKIIHLLEHLYPRLPQIACFDTAFHATMPDLHRRFALPRLWHERGVKRYGFHGLSYEYSAGRLRLCDPESYAGRVIIAHLGNGASLCALRNGRSHDTTMGFSALDGLMMGTRPGALDAGVMLYLLQTAGVDAKGLEKLLYRESGLRGVSGISADMQVLLGSAVPAAREAIDLFCLRVVRETGALISLLGGIDAFVFTGGIGEHAASVRRKIIDGLAWAGFLLDEASGHEDSGATGVWRLSAPDHKPALWCIAADEESVIARQACALLTPERLVNNAL